MVEPILCVPRRETPNIRTPWGQSFSRAHRPAAGHGLRSKPRAHCQQFQGLCPLTTLLWFPSLCSKRGPSLLLPVGNRGCPCSQGPGKEQAFGHTGTPSMGHPGPTSWPVQPSSVPWGDAYPIQEGSNRVRLPLAPTLSLFHVPCRNRI